MVYNLEICARPSGRAEEAEGFCRRVLVIHEKALGADRARLATALQNLGKDRL